MPAGDGLVAMRSDAVPRIARQLQEMLERAAAQRIELLLFPELFVDARLEALFAPLVDWARATGAYVVPGAFHVRETHASVCRVIGPTGILWEQEKHIPAIFTVDGRRSTEGIRSSTRRRMTVADTRFGRIAVAICRDFLDLDLRVALRNADPPVDIVLNPAFTPVTADFEAAHFEGRRSLYAYCVFCTAARFGTRSFRRRRRSIAAAGCRPAAKRSSSRMWTCSRCELLVATGRDAALRLRFECRRNRKHDQRFRRSGTRNDQFSVDGEREIGVEVARDASPTENRVLSLKEVRSGRK